tara:strand:- start:798 stop:1766 length:969 start_codon:yes stop_codon:yes gene_type:complete
MKLNYPKIWYKKNIFSYILLPISFIYGLCFAIDKAISSKVKFNKKLIAIGGCTVGGSGKTPLAIKLAEILQAKKLDFLFLAKGYKAEIKNPYLLTGVNEAKEVGDEALLLSKIAKTIISDKKYAAKNLIEGQDEEIVIIDDALQHHKIDADIKIMVVDGEFLFGNGMILPAGPLRENPEKLMQKSDFIIVINSDDKEHEIFQRFANKIFYAEYKFPKISKSQDKYFAFSALANNQKFKTVLERLDINLCGFKEFSDHYLYQEEDLDVLIEYADKENMKLITTSKDFVKIPKKYHSQIKEFKISLDLIGEKEFTKLLIQKLLC